MNHVINFVPEIVICAFLLAFGVITFVSAMITLGKSRAFGRKTSALLALSLATIFMAALWLSLGIDVTSEGMIRSPEHTRCALKLLFFPYAVLGIIVLLQMVVLAGRMTPQESAERADSVGKATTPVEPTAKKEKQAPLRTRRGRPPKKELPAEAKQAEMMKPTETKRESNGTTKTPEQG